MKVTPFVIPVKRKLCKLEPVFHSDFRVRMSPNNGGTFAIINLGGLCVLGK